MSLNFAARVVDTKDTMPRSLGLLCVVACLALPAATHADGTTPRPKKKPWRGVLAMKLRRGQRYVGSNSVSYNVTTIVRQADKERSSSEAVQVTEKFVDKILRSTSRGVLEMKRSYLLHYTKRREAAEARPNVYQSPLQGREVVVRERNRRREVKLDGRGVVDPLVRQTAGIEIDWRDIFPEDPVGPGDVWDADATALSRRLAAYLQSGSRSRMQVRFEQVVEQEGTRLAKLYVDWTLEGMRDRQLFTKVTLAGDVFFDLDLRRVVLVDLTGNLIVRGAIIGQGHPRIVKGEGQVYVKTSVKSAPVAASAGDEE
ncbi:MAG: hypothetical protein ACYTEZ_18980 [Planctomycetota bacterium]|jgi:hypothetical protein